jgi:hypothetical protein
MDAIEKGDQMATAEPFDRVIVLCERLAEATRQGNVEWKTEGDDLYVWEHFEGVVTIGTRDRDGQPPHALSIFNGEREKVEELGSALVEDDQPAPWNVPLADLYRVARRSALHADEIIDALISALPTRAEARSEA